MNAGVIVRDKNGNVYLKITGKPIEDAVYFLINCFNVKPESKTIKLSKEFLINLNAKES
jgi:hypothetical protein